MIVIRDNFLPESYLRFFKRQAADAIVTIGLWNKIFISPDKNVSTIYEFGPLWHSTCIMIQTFVKQEYNIKIYPYCARVQVCHETRGFGEHRDAPVRDSSSNASYSSIIYINDTWDSDCGGEINFSGKLVDPVYNRLLFFSRDEIHYVLPPKKKWSKPRATIMFSWDSDVE